MYFSYLNKGNPDAIGSQRSSPENTFPSWTPDTSSPSPPNTSPSWMSSMPHDASPPPNPIRPVIAYKTKMCRAMSETGLCRFAERCTFAHSEEELRFRSLQHPKYRTKPCNKFFGDGFCPFGEGCLFLHEMPAKEKKTDNSNITTVTSPGSTGTARVSHGSVFDDEPEPSIPDLRATGDFCTPFEMTVAESDIPDLSDDNIDAILEEFRLESRMTREQLFRRIGIVQKRFDEEFGPTSP
ncbi:hypothetical protein L596_012785 [Steinernema carpocapsae]|uniref:C3H1-type domain-containing protein n=1 Tax=Steinernema carpocapsae TaxID=34508 RepID=A0A4U5NYX5_STECR|nr:hypothetical protein L596_012785 [Steinernema carpocapsae]